ncbi:MAG: YfcC family protein [bacterium]
MTEKKWYQKLPNSYVLLFMIIVITAVMTYIIPAGSFERVEVGGRMMAQPGTFHYIERTPVSFIDIFGAIPLGIVEVANIIATCLVTAAMVEIINSTGALEAGVGVTIKKFGRDRKAITALIFVLTYLFGFLGFWGLESRIPFVPVGVTIALGLGLDVMSAAGVVIGGVFVGFATSPINPFTVGVAHSIAQLPVFSGLGLRSVYCFLSLGLMAHHTYRYSMRVLENPQLSLVSDVDTEGLGGLTQEIESYKINPVQKRILLAFVALLAIVVYGVIRFGWGIIDIATWFFFGAVVMGVIAGYNGNKMVDIMIRGASKMVGGSLIVGVARGIAIILTKGNISDTIINGLVSPLQGLPPMISGVLMSVVQSIINFFIPSGSGQASATMPIMIPIADLLGITRQTATLAFQVGDGIMNLLVPTLGGLMAMLAIARVPYDRWIAFIWPLALKLLVLGYAFVAFSVMINWGPF